LSIEIIDRRGLNKPEEVKPKTAAEKLSNRGKWKSVASYIVIIPARPDPIAMFRSVGLREDGKVFVGDYIIDQWFTTDQQWMKKARERLDTFIDCECQGPQAVCSVHQQLLKQWLSQDQKRREYLADTPMPEALESLMRLDRAAKRQQEASSIVIPR
jgi:hypothetical protein